VVKGPEKTCYPSISKKGRKNGGGGGEEMGKVTFLTGECTKERVPLALP